MALNQVPQAGQTLAATQAPILNNFSTIDTAFSVDHVSYQAATQGKHNKVTFPVQAATPTFSGSDIQVFSKVPSLANGDHVTLAATQLFINGTNFDQIPFTAGSTALINTAGYTFLPSGLLIKWEKHNINSLGDTTINFVTDTTIPVFGTVLSAFVTPYINGSASSSMFTVSLHSFTTTSITIWAAGTLNNSGASYIVIGTAA